MRTVILLLAAAAMASAQPNRLASREEAAGWLLLFDGDSLFGWTPEGKGEWHVADGAIVGDSGGDGWLRQNAVFSDYVLHIEFRASTADTNSGIFFRSAPGADPHRTGFELQIWDKHEKYPTGSLVNFASTDKGHLTPGQWQSFDLEVVGDHYVVRLDGRIILDAHDAHSLAGHLGLQHKEGNAIAFRNIKLKPLGLKPLFADQGLTGWKVTDAPKTAQKPEWTMSDGTLHVEKGPGGLESEAQFKDFVLQIEVRTNPQSPGQHPNSGVFVRGTPGVFWSGYELQVQNGYKNGDRAQPEDFGTGAIYRNQPARKVVANDGKEFVMTAVAHGRHFSVWVDGHPVTDWEDPHPEGASVRAKEAVLGPGVIILQAHDPTTNLDFRDLRVAELPN
jgi:hypothetical protein